MLWSSVFRIMEDRKRLFVLGALLSDLYILVRRGNGTADRKDVRSTVEISTNSVSTVSISLLLGLFEDKFSYMTIKILIRDFGRDTGAH